jgi:hypothetical protein
MSTQDTLDIYSHLILLHSFMQISDRNMMYGIKNICACIVSIFRQFKVRESSIRAYIYNQMKPK